MNGSKHISNCYSALQGLYWMSYGAIYTFLIHFMVESKIVIYYKISLFPEEIRGPKDQKEVKQHEQV